MSELTLFHNGRVSVHAGDCLDVLGALSENSVDSVVTDPPYALTSIVKRFGKTSLADGTQTSDRSRKGADGYARLAKGFMGKEWDNGAVAFSAELWARALRVLKPGGHLLAFGGTRTFHRLACAIEDGGFEIRDAVIWHYGSGFPKSHDVSKGIDRAAGAVRVATGEIRRASIQRNGAGADWEAGAFASHPEATKRVAITASATESAREWEGWGTALKPATEIICLARKPLSEKTVAANVLRWGTGALNIDGTRIGTRTESNGIVVSDNMAMSGANYGRIPVGETVGRWPANACHDGSDEVLTAFPDNGGARGGNPRERNGTRGVVYGAGLEKGGDRIVRNDSGSAARFFFSAKADRDDRLGTFHPTVKPVDLMQWLCRMVTPRGGTVLDPFAGTGTTGEAALRDGFKAILIEREAEYREDISRRMSLFLESLDERSRQSIKARGQLQDAGPLFDVTGGLP